MRRPARTASAVLAATLALALAAPAGARGPDRSSAERRAPALKVVTVRGGLDNPTGFTFAPNGRIWYIEKNTGRIYILNRDTGGRRLFTDISRVSGLGERGGLGIALHPDWPARRRQNTR